VLITLKAKTFVINCYASDINPFFFHKKKIINIWHGIPIKEIETSSKIDYYNNEYFWAQHLSPKLCLIDTFIVPSHEFFPIFKSAFADRVKRFIVGSTPRFRKNFVLDAGTLYLSSIDENINDSRIYFEIINSFKSISNIKPHPKDQHHPIIKSLHSACKSRTLYKTSPIIIFESSLIFHAPKGTRFLTSHNTYIAKLPNEIELIKEHKSFNEYILKDQIGNNSRSINSFKDIECK
jgi:hypothetical protein